jgi:hypothetical protein
MMRALWSAALAFLPGLALAADGAISTWVSGAGPSAKTYVLKARGTTCTGVVCGPCDDPSTVFRIAEGRAADDTHALTRVDGEGTLMATVKSLPAPKTPRLDAALSRPAASPNRTSPSSCATATPCGA